MAFQGSYTPLRLDTTGRPWLRPKPCVCCASTPTRLYASGWRCEHHATADFSDAFVMITGRLFDGTEFRRDVNPGSV